MQFSTRPDLVARVRCPPGRIRPAQGTYTPAVNWSTALPTLLGTIVGASVTLLADRVRWRRDQHQRRHDARRDAYATYLAALHATSDGIRAVSLGEHTPETPKPSAARAVFRSANLNATREQLVLRPQRRSCERPTRRSKDCGNCGTLLARDTTLSHRTTNRFSIDTSWP